MFARRPEDCDKLFCENKIHSISSWRKRALALKKEHGVGFEDHPEYKKHLSCKIDESHDYIKYLSAKDCKSRNFNQSRQSSPPSQQSDWSPPPQQSDWSPPPQQSDWWAPQDPTEFMITEQNIYVLDNLPDYVELLNFSEINIPFKFPSRFPSKLKIISFLEVSSLVEIPEFPESVINIQIFRCFNITPTGKKNETKFYKKKIKNNSFLSLWHNRTPKGFTLFHDYNFL